MSEPLQADQEPTARPLPGKGDSLVCCPHRGLAGSPGADRRCGNGLRYSDRPLGSTWPDRGRGLDLDCPGAPPCQRPETALA